MFDHLKKRDKIVAISAALKHFLIGRKLLDQ